MGIDDFWDKYDPEVRRYEDRQQETPVNPDAPTGPLIGEPLGAREFPATSTSRCNAEITTESTRDQSHPQSQEIDYGIDIVKCQKD